MFTACHPVLSREARAALSLKVLAGLTTQEIARAFLVPEATMAQRIVRAKRTLSDARVPFEIPRRQDLAARLSSVFEVIYLVFNEGYSATAGEDWMRPALCEEALRLGRILAELVPHRGRSSRARRPHGDPGVPHPRARERQRRADPAHGAEPGALGSPPHPPRTHCARPRRDAGVARGPYLLQAAIAACHARAITAGDTDWVYITALYDELARTAPTPVVELNRAVAVSMAYGPAAGLELADKLAADGALESYHLLPSVRGDLLKKLGRYQEARGEFERAALLTHNARESRLLLERAAACVPQS